MAAIVDQHGNIITARPKLPFSDQRYKSGFRKRLSAKYDAAQTTDENERHWANADYLSSNKAANPGVRRRMRARARYEAQENNSYAKGMILTLANDMIGTGPKLQLNLPDTKANQHIERSFRLWAEEIQLAEKLRTMRIAKVVDGEAFALLTTNKRLAHQVQLDIHPIEADYVQSPYDSLWATEDQEVDGIQFDEDRNPVSYYVLNHHPGGSYGDGSGEWTEVGKILHVFRADRPGQRRGVTEIATALPLFAMLRRFTLATLAAAETAADFAAVMRTTTGSTSEAETLGEDQWFDAIPIEYRMMLTLPNGWDITQLKAEHPTTTYEMFKNAIINEIARCLNMPFNVAAANSQDYNYASGRLDHQVYFKSIAVERHQWTCSILRKIFMAWLKEAMWVENALPEGLPPFAEWQWEWYWDAHEHVDPSKNANAVQTNMKTGNTNRKIELAKQGFDVDTHDEQAAESLGITVPEYRRGIWANIVGAPAIMEQDNAEE